MTVLIGFVLVVCAGMFSWALKAVIQRKEDDQTLLLSLRKEQEINISTLVRCDGRDVFEQGGNENYIRKVASMGRRSSILVTVAFRLQRQSSGRDEYLEMCVSALLLRLAFWGCVAEFCLRGARKFLSTSPVYLPLFFPRIAAEICEHMERTAALMLEAHQT